MSDIFDGMSAAVSAVADIVYDEAIINEIKSILADGASDLHQGRHLHATGDGSYGASPAGADLARNAGLARQKVIEAITDMSAGLEGYRTVVDEFHARSQQADGDAQSALTTITRATDCAAQPQIKSPSQCTMPGASGGEN